MRFGRAIAPAVLAALAVVTQARAGLNEYVQRPEPDFSWKLEKADKIGKGTVYTIHLVSQTWQGIKWEHKLLVLKPDNVKPTSSMLLINTGGAPTGLFQAFALQLTERIGSPVAIVFGVPNQPLFEGKKEDALIAETFVRFLDGGGKDESWPLLFPMVKTVVKAMDALQEFSKKEWDTELKDFIVSGASKRGWTSWLTGAADPRVRAIVPMVIDTLNMKPQMEHQIMCYGKPSDMVRDYIERKLIPMPNTEEAKRLWSMVDPYFYRDKLKMPKLIINGANDAYWTVDALNIYWNELPGEKYVLIVPNAGHSLEERPDGGIPNPLTARKRVLDSTLAFTKLQVAGKSMPKLSWEHSDADGKLRLTVQSSTPPKSARLWVAESDKKDFRLSRWKQHPAEVSADGTQVVGTLGPPKQGYLAFYGELDFDADGLPYTLSTQVRVAAAP
jgi:PhoPQ-activated pathogenicity-related protein